MSVRRKAPSVPSNGTASGVPEAKREARIDGDAVVCTFDLAYRARVAHESVLREAEALGANVWFRPKTPVAILNGERLRFRGDAVPESVAPLDEWNPEHLFTGWLAIDPQQPDPPAARSHLRPMLGLTAIARSSPGFVHRVTCGFSDAGAFLPAPACILDPAVPGGFGVRAVASDELYLRRSDAVRVAPKLGLAPEAMDAPPPTAHRRLPDWASWEALADALDPAHRDFSPELAVAFRVWADVYRATQGAKRQCVGDDDAAERAGKVWASTVGPPPIAKLSKTRAEFIAALVRPGFKKEGRPPKRKSRAS